MGEVQGGQLDRAEMGRDEDDGPAGECCLDRLRGLDDDLALEHGGTKARDAQHLEVVARVVSERRQHESLQSARVAGGGTDLR